MTRNTNAQKAVWRALFGPANVLVALGAAGGAAFFHSLAVLSLGGLTYAALVAHDLLQERSSAAGARRTKSAPAEWTDPETRSAAEQLERALDEVERALKEAPGAAAEHGLSTAHSAEQLRAHAELLLARAEFVSRYLTRIDVNSARSNAEQLAARAEGSRDEQARAHYRQASDVAKEKLLDLADLISLRERVLANVAHIATTLSGVAVKFVRTGALDEQAQDALRGDLERELTRVSREIKIFEETLELLGEA